MGIVLNALNVHSAEGYYYYGGRYTDRYYDEESPENGAAASRQQSFLTDSLYLPLAGWSGQRITSFKDTDQMRIELRSPLRKFFFAAACFVLIGLYLGLSLRAYLATRLAAVPDLPNLQKAIRLEPANAEYRELLGRNLAVSGANLDDAISNYRTAVHLNPYEARYWLDLAGAYQVAGRTSEQEESVEHAVEADPTTPHVAWEAANFFLVQGDREKALRHFRVVLANDPDDG